MKLVNSIKKFFCINSTEDDESKIINNEEVIRIDTRTNEYRERV